ICEGARARFTAILFVNAGGFEARDVDDTAGSDASRPQALHSIFRDDVQKARYSSDTLTGLLRATGEFVTAVALELLTTTAVGSFRFSRARLLNAALTSSRFRVTARRSASASPDSSLTTRTSGDSSA